jgi:hypothetical protein
MKNPRVSAIVSLVAIVLVGSSMLFSTEAPDMALATLQWVLLAGGVVGLVSSLIQMANGR